MRREGIRTLYASLGTVAVTAVALCGWLTMQRKLDAEQKERSQVYITILERLAPSGQNPVVLQQRTTFFYYGNGQSTNSGSSTDRDGISALADRLSKLEADPEVVTSLYYKNRKPLDLAQCDVGNNIRLATKKELDAIVESSDFWAAFNTMFSTARGLYRVSNVGFNEEMTEALVYLGGQSGPLSGRGEVYHLRRIKQEWSVVGCVEVWIS